MKKFFSARVWLSMFCLIFLVVLFAACGGAQQEQAPLAPPKYKTVEVQSKDQIPSKIVELTKEWVSPNTKPFVYSNGTTIRYDQTDYGIRLTISFKQDIDIDRVQFSVHGQVIETYDVLCSYSDGIGYVGGDSVKFRDVNTNNPVAWVKFDFVSVR